MKAVDLNKLLKERGFYIIRTSKHIIWSNGKKHIAVPHKKEINKMLAKRLLKEIE